MIRWYRALVALGAVLVCVVAGGTAPAGAAQTFTVNSPADTDDGCTAAAMGCTLREAINAANMDADPDTINFSLGSGVQTIAVGAGGLPPITQPVTINGNTGGATRIELDGTAAGAGADGLRITGGIGSTIRALIINRFTDDGIEIVGPSSGNKIEGSFIGTSSAGTAASNNLGDGVSVMSSADNVIGGLTASARNVLSGNDDGVSFSAGVRIEGAGANNNHVQGNYIGLDVNGTTVVRNINGVLILGGTGNTVGGTTAAARNVISGNLADGVQISTANSVGAHSVLGNYLGTDVTGMSDRHNGFFGVRISQSAGNFIGGTTGTTPGGACTGACNVISSNQAFSQVFIGAPASTGNIIRGNFIGLNALGTGTLPGGNDGVYIEGASDTIIGGTTANARNVISGQPRKGVHLLSSSAYGNPLTTGILVQGNFIGTDTTGTQDLGNWDYGVWLDGPSLSGNTIGGTLAGAGNVIAYNDTGIVADPDAAGNAILGNSIFANIAQAYSGLGIDLTGDYVTANDEDDPDTGANNLQNYPVLTSATSGSTTIEGSLNSTPSTQFRVEFFANSECDPTGYGEGETYLGFTNVITDANGDAAIDVVLPATAAVGDFVTSTATDPSFNTSEFSQCIPVVAGATPTPTPSGSPTPTPTPTGTGTTTATPTPTPTGTGTTTATPGTPTVTGSGSPTPTETPSGSETPTPTAGPPVKGDGDCDGDVDLDDVIAALSEFASVDPGAPCDDNADVDCDDDVDGEDALRIVAHIAGVPMTPPGGCGPIGV